MSAKVTTVLSFGPKLRLDVTASTYAIYNYMSIIISQTSDGASRRLGDQTWIKNHLQNSSRPFYYKYCTYEPATKIDLFSTEKRFKF